MQLLNVRVIGIAGLVVAMGITPLIGVAASLDRDHAATQEAVNGNGPAALPAARCR